MCRLTLLNSERVSPGHPYRRKIFVQSSAQAIKIPIAYTSSPFPMKLLTRIKAPPTIKRHPPWACTLLWSVWLGSAPAPDSPGTGHLSRIRCAWLLCNSDRPRQKREIHKHKSKFKIDERSSSSSSYPGSGRGGSSSSRGTQTSLSRDDVQWASLPDEPPQLTPF